MGSELVHWIATKHKMERELAVYLLAIGLLSTVVVGGTTKPEHMSNDLQTVSKFCGDDQLQEELQLAAGGDSGGIYGAL